jgi:tetratricopeptide (TPR) repeat protein
MVIVFGVGFAFLGVGSGGLDLGSMIQDVFGNGGGGGGGASISDAQKQVRAHPRQAAAYKKLADAYRDKGQTDNQITALEQYVKLAPKDASQVEQLAALLATQAGTAATEANAAYAQQQALSGGSALGPASSTKPGQALGTDPITQAMNTDVSGRLQKATTKYQSDSAQAIKMYQRLAKLRPDEQSYFALAQTAEQFGNSKVAIVAYRGALKRVSDPATKSQLRAKIAALKKSAGG